MCLCSCAKLYTRYCYYLQITHSRVVETLMLHYKNDLVKVINELRLPYNIDVLARIRRDCFHQNFSDPNSLQHTQVHVSSKSFRQIFFFTFFTFSFFISFFCCDFNFTSFLFFFNSKSLKKPRPSFFNILPKWHIIRLYIRR